ncbi:competence protein [Klebsiella sp. H-Nf2]|uniref:TfoX/Sxy family DNA transformation protein n=1 Tax=unclassified Klebsiella TaxID=2608929 RepID=UPI000C28372B|nr:MULTISPECIES: TfoX/Sxy family DNA transformation protein [unclassified Klebsiella]PJR49184.1 competence protein [Klebsiella sp. H-Nf2]PJX41955.1 competence protein [Klebsiella sp. C-Nf10]PJX54191.1 competence protein [Klebsiella sp. D-Nf1]
MRKLVCPRFPQFQACVSPLGQLHSRPLFGGYSLAIDDTVFAMVAEGDIYLRACEQSAAYRVEHRNPLLTLRRHGRIVPMKYYQIDDALWRDETQLFRLSLLSWQSAQREKYHRRESGRLKDLPNISFHMELQLIHAGIPDVRTLREVGAQQAWQRLRENNASLSVNVLLALDGAIVGVHTAALPTLRRQELLEWAGAR